MSENLVIHPRLTIPARDLAWHAVRASGKGGQNVNKVATKVALRFELAKCAVLAAAEKARLQKIAGPAHCNSEGQIVITSDRTRSQTQNVHDARARLREMILRALIKPKKRIATSPSRTAKRRRLENKHRQSEKKRMRRVEY